MTIPLRDLSAFELVLYLLTQTCLKKLPVAPEERSLSSVKKRKTNKKEQGYQGSQNYFFNRES